MRLDKYLKVARIIKRRTISKDLASLGRVQINGRVAKPSTEVTVGDVLLMHLKDRNLSVRVNAIKEYCKSDDADSMFVVLSEEFFNENKE